MQARMYSRFKIRAFRKSILYGISAGEVLKDSSSHIPGIPDPGLTMIYIRIWRNARQKVFHHFLEANAFTKTNTTLFWRTFKWGRYRAISCSSALFFL